MRHFGERCFAVVSLLGSDQTLIRQLLDDLLCCGVVAELTEIRPTAGIFRAFARLDQAQEHPLDLFLFTGAEMVEDVIGAGFQRLFQPAQPVVILQHDVVIPALFP